jgi:hypothetical protein
VEVGSHQTRYYVHYLGWNKRYDEWVTTNLIRADEPATEDFEDLGKVRKRSIFVFITFV